MLYIVPVPVGNLEDITIRAIKILEKSEVILCEDGRVTSKLLNLLEIKNKPRFVNLAHNHNFSYAKVSAILDEVLGAEKVQDLSHNFYYSRDFFGSENERVVALVSDAGTPGISDPGYEVIKLAQDKKIAYTCLPGASAVLPAVVNSNLVSKEFLFLGFLPIKKGRKTAWDNIIRSQTPVVLYESNHRIEKFFEEVFANLEEGRKISFSREISKKFEEIFVGSVGDLKQINLKPKGEFVVVIDGIK